MTTTTRNRADLDPQRESTSTGLSKQQETSNYRTFGATWLVFTLTAGTIGFAWHEVLFKSEYESFNFISADEPVVLLALLSMLTLGFISSYLFTRLFDRAKGLSGGMGIGLVVLAVPRLAVTLARASEQDVNGHVPDLIFYETTLYVLMGLTWGALAAVAHRPTKKTSATKGITR